MKSIFFLTLVLASSAALATGKPTPAPAPAPTAVAGAGAISGAAAGAHAGAAVDNRNANANRLSSANHNANTNANRLSSANHNANANTNANHNASLSGATASGQVDVAVAGDRSEYDSYALVLPGLVAAPSVGGTCLVHTRGIGGFSVGVTGSTMFDAECMRKQHCLAVADRLAAWQQYDAAVRQLQTCDGVPHTFKPVLPNPPTDVRVGVTHEELEQVVKEQNERLDRAFRLKNSK